MPLIPLEVDHQTVHVVPKYEIQIRCKIGENCSSLEVKTFLLFFGLTFQLKSGKNCGFSEVDWSFHQVQKNAHPQPFPMLKKHWKAITLHHCLMKPMQRGFNNGNTGVAGILQKQR